MSRPFPRKTKPCSGSYSLLRRNSLTDSLRSKWSGRPVNTSTWTSTFSVTRSVRQQKILKKMKKWMCKCWVRSQHRFNPKRICEKLQKIVRRHWLYLPPWSIRWIVCKLFSTAFSKRWNSNRASWMKNLLVKFTSRNKWEFIRCWRLSTACHTSKQSKCLNITKSTTKRKMTRTYRSRCNKKSQMI